MKTLISCMLIVMVIHSYAQPYKRPCPRFVIDTAKGKALRTNLTAYFPAIGNHLEVDSVYVDKKSFLRMLKHLILDEDVRVNFRVNGLRVILGQEGKKLKLIFTGGKDSEDTREYFAANENGILQPRFDLENLQTLAANYASTTLPYVNSISPANTTSYLFNNGLMYDMITELTRQKDNGNIKGLNFKLGAYDSTHALYPRKLLIGFSFVKNDNTEVILQELSAAELGCELEKEEQVKAALIKEFKHRFAGNKIRSAANEEEIKAFVDYAIKTLAAINGDTGVPCPPGKNCSTASIQQP